MFDHLLAFCRVKSPWEVRMAHGVNDWKCFRAFLQDHRVHMIEIDVEDYGGPIRGINLSHEGKGDLTFSEAVKRLIKHHKALKLDLRLIKGQPYRSEFFEFVLRSLSRTWDWQIPLWINGNVLKGPNWRFSHHEVLPGRDFTHLYRLFRRNHSLVSLSLGYLTGYRRGRAEAYDQKMFRAMKVLVDLVSGPVTIALRYANLKESPEIINQFLNLGAVTLWNREEEITESDYQLLKAKLIPLPVFKDLTGKNGLPLWD